MTSSAVPLKGECAEYGGLRHPKLSLNATLPRTSSRYTSIAKILGWNSQFNDARGRVSGPDSPTCNPLAKGEPHLLACLRQVHPGLQVVGVCSEDALICGRAQPDIPHAHLAKAQEVPRLHM